MCDEACLEIGEDTVPCQTVANCLQSIGSKPITYNNDLPILKWALILKRQINYVEDIIVTRDMENIGTPMK